MRGAPHEWSDRRYPIVEDLRFQRRFWLLQRVGWGGMAIVVLLALAGAFATGPLSSIERSAGDGQIQVRAERFLRLGKGAVWQITLQPQAGRAELRLNAALMRAVTIENIQPQPASASSSEAGLTLGYEAMPGQPVVVFVWARPTAVGVIAAAFGSGAGARVTIDHVVYP